ncbi:hypothetical protein AV540_15515 [Brevibacillus parabrevis]|uniref:restriction endonuclease subunit S n=1 Tax=Brevibacillus parabrevis TaxID=54914 RepID=UPI0007AB9322|nr:restriction endonuclease subunit S [Brevibacillus parabrevis]KZE48988.1 hypothetical protein AV540_15515 [Brevibacillus parabrevis]
MSKWDIVKLGDVCTINPTKKATLNLYESLDEVSFVPMSDVSEDGRIFTGNKVRYSEVSSGYSYFIEDDILFAKITPCMENGKGAIARGLINGLGAGSTEFHILRPKQNLVISEWIYRFLSYSKFRKSAEKNMTGSAGQKRVPKAFLENVLIPLPPLETQKQIAKILDTAAELLAMRKQQLAELDNLTKSVFYEMFGDPVVNEKGWDVKTLNDISILITKGSSPTWQGINYTEDTSQVLFVTSENVREGYLDFSKRKYVENRFNEIQKRSILEYGDILINIVGASIGRAAVFYSNEKANINQAVALVRCHKDVCLPYLCYYFNSPKAIQMYGEMQVDVARANLSLKNIGELAVIYPPIEFQSQFATIVTKIEEQKSLVKKAIDETQYLFDSLMAQYFD